MSEKHSILSPSLECADRDTYDDHDVFGHEEEHDVRISILISSELMSEVLHTAQNLHFSKLVC